MMIEIGRDRTDPADNCPHFSKIDPITVPPFVMLLTSCTSD